MDKILSYENLQEIKFNELGNHFLILRGFHKNDKHYPCYHDGFALRASDWRDFSQKFCQAASYEDHTEHNSTVGFNHFPAQLSAYNKILALLLAERSMEYLGITDTYNPEEKIAKIDDFVNDRDKMAALNPASAESIKRIYQARDGKEIFYLEFPSFMQVEAFNNIHDLIKMQLFITAKYNADDVIVLNGDGQVKSFIEEKGESLLEQIEPWNAQTPGQKYLKGFSAQLSHILSNKSCHLNFPKAAAYNKITPRERG